MPSISSCHPSSSPTSREATSRGPGGTCRSEVGFQSGQVAVQEAYQPLIDVTEGSLRDLHVSALSGGGLLSGIPVASDDLPDTAPNAG